MQADAFLFQLLVRPGDAVIVESPTYDRTLLNLRNRGADVRMVDARDRRDRRRRRSSRCSRDGACARSSRTSSPTSRTRPATRCSAAKRARLLALAAEHDFTLFEDDPYIAIRFEGEPLPTMLSQDEAGKVVYASSFSKTVCPGIRVGYLVGPQAVIKQIQGDRDQHLHLAEHGRPVDRQPVLPLRADRRRDRDGQGRAARRAATRSSPRSSASCPRRASPPPQGGYFMWVELPEDVDVAELEKAARGARACVFVKGTDFLLEGGENTLRLAYSGVTPEQIDEGITRLAEAARSLGVAA